MGSACMEMWNSETRGYYMEVAHEKCGNTIGWIPGHRSRAAAFCVGCPACTKTTTAMPEPTTEPTPEPTPELTPEPTPEPTTEPTHEPIAPTPAPDFWTDF